MVKQKLIFHNTSNNNNNTNTTSNNNGKTQKKKSQPVKQPENPEQTPVAPVVTSSTTTNVQENIKTVVSDAPVMTEYEEDENDVTTVNEQTAMKQLNQLRKKMKKFSKLEEEIQTDLDIMQVKLKSMKNKKKKGGADEQNAFLEKKLQLKQTKYNQRLKQMQDMVDFIKTTHLGVESLDSVMADVVKMAQKKDVQIKSSLDQLKGLEKQMNKKDKQLSEQEKFISEFDMHSSLHDTELSTMKKNLQLEEEKSSTLQRQVNQLKEQLATVEQRASSEKEKSGNSTQQHEQLVQKLRQELKEKEAIIEQRIGVENQKAALITNHVSDLRQKAARILELESKLQEQSISLKNVREEALRAQSMLKMSEDKFEDLSVKYNAQTDELNKRKSVQEILNTDLHNFRTKYAQLQHNFKMVDRDARTYFAQVQDLEHKLREQPPIFVPVKFEEDILDEVARQREISTHALVLKDVVKLIQVVDYFDISKPDGMDVRHMFISDQIGLRRDGKFTMFNSLHDFDAFDHMCRVLRGSQQSTQSRESAVSDAVTMIQRLLARHNDEITPGTTFKQLDGQIVELLTSNIYLTGRTLYPYNGPDSGSDVSFSYSASSRDSTRNRPDLFTNGFDYNNKLDTAKVSTNQSKHSVEENQGSTPLYVISSNTTATTEQSPPIDIPTTHTDGFRFDSIGVKLVRDQEEDMHSTPDSTPKKQKQKKQPKNRSASPPSEVEAQKQKPGKQKKLKKVKPDRSTPLTDSSSQETLILPAATAPVLPSGDEAKNELNIQAQKVHTKKKPLLVSVIPVAPEAPLSEPTKENQPVRHKSAPKKVKKFIPVQEQSDTKQQPIAVSTTAKASPPVPTTHQARTKSAKPDVHTTAESSAQPVTKKQTTPEANTEVEVKKGKDAAHRGNQKPHRRKVFVKAKPDS